MVEFVEITDRESLEAWMEGQPREVSIWIANRAAMRVLPEWWYYVLNSFIAKHADLSALQTLQHNLISGVASKMLSAEIKHTATAVEVAGDDEEVMGDTIGAALSASIEAGVYSNTTYSELGTATNAARAADDAIKTINAATHGAYAVNAVTDTFLDFWALVESDCAAITAKDDLYRRPLWCDQNNPLDTKWKAVKEQISVTNPLHPEEIARGAVDWSFWIKWYDAALAGTPLNWDMLEEIVLIDPAEWEKGPAWVNLLIGEIEKEYARKATPNAEDIIVNEDGKYQAVPRSAIPAQTLRDANGRIGDVIRHIRDAQKSSNQYTALLPEADLLEDIKARYGGNALRLFEVCSKVVIHVGRHVGNGVLPENDNVVGDITGDLQNTADDIYSFDAEAKVAIDARAKLRFERLTDGRKKGVLQLVEAVAQNSVKDMADEMREDATVVAGEVEPSGETTPSRYRLGSRLVRVVAIGGAGLVVVTTALSQAEGAVAGAQYLWQIIRPLIGF